MKTRTTAPLLAALLLAFTANPAHAGVITKVEDCGSKGRLVQLRVSGNEGDTVTLRLDGTYTVDADFVPSRAAAQAKFRLTAETAFGDLRLDERDTGPLEPGKKHTATGSIRIGGVQLVGHTVKIRATVHGGLHQELCLKFTARATM